MVASYERLEAGANSRAAIVLTKLNGLVHETVTVSEVSRLGGPKVDAEALFGARTVRKRFFSKGREIENRGKYMLTSREHEQSSRYRHQSGHLRSFLLR